MYEQFFGLNRPPFKITPDTSLFYDGGRRGDILGALAYAVQRGEGIVKVVGEVGSGKTMLCRMLQQELPESVEIIYIANPSVSADDILFVIAHELNLDVKKDSSKHEVMHMLQTHLLKRFTGNRQVVLFVEEAQGMPLETLEEIRLLSNLETDQDKLLQIILFGQPELDDNLKTSSIRQLKERITHEFNLTPLTEKEIHQYLNFRMREVGYTGPELIDERVAKVVAKYSGGLLRRINIIADKVLLSAFAENTHDITVKHVKAAVQDSGFERSIDGRLTSDNKAIYLMLLLLIILLAWLFASGRGAMLMAEFMPEPEQQEQIQKKIEPKVVVKAKAFIEPKIKVLKKEKVEPIKIQEPQLDVIAQPMISAVKKQINRVVSEAQLADSQGEERVIVAIKVAEKKSDEDKLVSIIPRKKKDGGSETPLKREESHKSIKIVKKSLSKFEERTKISNVDSKKITFDDVANYKNADWLSWKLEESKVWLSQQSNKGVSIQVMMRSQTASNELVDALRAQWPLDVKKTFLYEVEMNGNRIYRVFYGGFSSLSVGQNELKELPEEVKSNGPYLHSIYKMKKTLL